MLLFHNCARASLSISKAFSYLVRPSSAIDV